MCGAGHLLRRHNNLKGADMNPTITLAQIRALKFRRNSWQKLKTAYGLDLSVAVSFGDIAVSNGAEESIWCVQALDWSNIAIRRAVVAALLPSVRRVNANRNHWQIEACVDIIERWCSGDDSINMNVPNAVIHDLTRNFLYTDIDTRPIFHSFHAIEFVHSDAANAVRLIAISGAGNIDADYAAWCAVRAIGWAVAGSIAHIEAKNFNSAMRARNAAARDAKAALLNDIIAAFPPMHATRKAA